jgi:hypothetical protein
MSEVLKPQYAVINQQCDGDLSAFCPICGKVTAKDGPGYTPCEHLAFMYLNLTDGFEYCSDDFKKRTENLDLEELTFDTFVDCLEPAGYDNRLLVVEVTQSCNPVGVAVIYGFDYGC